jgi:hypothetical protein
MNSTHHSTSYTFTGSDVGVHQFQYPLSTPGTAVGVHPSRYQPSTPSLAENVDPNGEFDFCPWAVEDDFPFQVDDIIESNAENIHPNVDYSQSQKQNPFLPSTVTYRGFTYTVKKREINKKAQPYGTYRCSGYRRTACPATLKITVLYAVNGTKPVYESNREHTCSLRRRTDESSVVDLKSEMKTEIVKQSIEQVSVPAKIVANQVLDNFKQAYAGQAFTGLNTVQLEQMVYRARKKEYSDWEALVQSPPLCYFAPKIDHRLFFQFINTINLDNTVQKIVGWAHPDLLFLTMHGLQNLFVDCTFKTAPSGFAQLMVFMTFSRAHCTYVPFFYVLLQSKKEDAYFYAIQSVISATSWKIDASTITYDFETSLMKAMKNQFRNAFEVGCFFHWKQALLKKLIKLKLPDTVIHQLIGHEEGLLNLLTVVPIDEIRTKAVPYIEEKINQPGLLDVFWSYFFNTWMKKYDPQSWNINHIPPGKEDDILINRTKLPTRTLQPHFEQGAWGTPQHALVCEWPCFTFSVHRQRPGKYPERQEANTCSSSAKQSFTSS